MSTWRVWFHPVATTVLFVFVIVSQIVFKRLTFTPFLGVKCANAVFRSTKTSYSHLSMSQMPVTQIMPLLVVHPFLFKVQCYVVGLLVGFFFLVLNTSITWVKNHWPSLSQHFYTVIFPLCSLLNTWNYPVQVLQWTSSPAGKRRHVKLQSRCETQAELAAECLGPACIMNRAERCEVLAFMAGLMIWLLGSKFSSDQQQKPMWRRGSGEWVAGGPTSVMRPAFLRTAAPTTRCFLRRTARFLSKSFGLHAMSFE